MRTTGLNLPLTAKAVALTAGVGLLLAGCTGGGTNPGEPGSSSTGSADPGQAANTTAAKSVDASDELDDVTCKHGDDGWTFEGKIKNAGKQAMIYTVTVRIAPKSNKNSTIGLTTVTKQVEPSKTVDFLAKNFSKLAAKDNTCLAQASKS